MRGDGERAALRYIMVESESESESRSLLSDSSVI